MYSKRQRLEFGRRNTGPKQRTSDDSEQVNYADDLKEYD